MNAHDFARDPRAGGEGVIGHTSGVDVYISSGISSIGRTILDRSDFMVGQKVHHATNFRSVAKVLAAIGSGAQRL